MIGWIILGLAIAVVIGLSYTGKKKVIIEEPRVEPVIEKDDDLTDTDNTDKKVIVEDFKDVLSNEDFVKKEPQTERVITEHIKSVIDKDVVKTKRVYKNSRKNSKK